MEQQSQPTFDVAYRCVDANGNPIPDHIYRNVDTFKGTELPCNKCARMLPVSFFDKTRYRNGTAFYNGICKSGRL